MPVQLTFDNKAANRVMMSSARMDWCTPEWLYKSLDGEFDFDYDPCPPNPRINGLDSVWGQCTYCNPPYGRGIGAWLRKGYAESKQGKTVVFLLPSRTDTKWWHEYVALASEIRFIRGRIKFKGARYNAPFPSVIVIFRGGNHEKSLHRPRLGQTDGLGDV